MAKQFIGTIENYVPHKGQRKLHTTNAKEVVVTSSIRSGKSYGIIHDVILRTWNDRSGFPSLVCAPTYKMVNAIIADEVAKKCADYGILHKYRKFNHEIVLKNGNMIFFRSLDKPDSIRGLSVSRAYIDECAMCTKYAIDLVRGRLLTTNGQLFLISTPRGLDNWLYEDYFQKPLDHVDYIKFNIFDNPIITKDAFDRLLKSYDPILARQELFGEFVNLRENQVYYAFSLANVMEYNTFTTEDMTNAQVYVGIDFNVGINATIFAIKRHDNSVVIFDEMIGQHSTTDLANAIKVKYGTDVVIIDDAASGGSRQQSTGKTNRDILRQAGLSRIHTKNRNPAKMDRISLVNASFQNALGEKMLYITNNCKTLINEIRSLSYKQGTGEIDAKQGSMGHITDALGYLVHYINDAEVPKKKPIAGRIDYMRNSHVSTQYIEYA